MKSQRAVRFGILVLLLAAALTGCHDSPPEKVLKETESAGKDVQQLGPRLVSVKSSCAGTSVQIQNSIAKNAAPTPTATPTATPTLTAFSGAPVWMSPQPPPPLFPDVDPQCLNAINQYMLIAKAIHGDDRPSPIPGHPPIPGDNLWATSPWYRQQVLLALGSTLRQSGGNVLSGPELMLFAANHPDAVNAMTAPFGVSGSEVMGLMQGGYLPPPTTPTFAPIGMPSGGTLGLGSQPTLPPVPGTTGFGLGQANPQIGSLGSMRSAPAPTGVSSGATLNVYRARYGADWFQRRAVRTGN